MSLLSLPIQCTRVWVKLCITWHGPRKRPNRMKKKFQGQGQHDMDPSLLHCLTRGLPGLLSSYSFYDKHERAAISVCRTIWSGVPIIYRSYLRMTAAQPL